MRSLRIVFTILCVVTISKSNILAGGSEVVIVLNSGTNISHAELLAARDSSIVISFSRDASEADLMNREIPVAEIHKDSIKSLILLREGGSYAGTGAVVGFVVGSIIGYGLTPKPGAHGNDSGMGGNTDSENSFGERVPFALVGGACTALIGTVLGAIVSDDLVVSRALILSPGFLREYARFKIEPEHLKSVVAKPDGKDWARKNLVFEHSGF
jgi:hypothetical protein